MSDSHQSREHLIDVLLQVPGLESRATRDARIAALSDALTRDLVFERSDDVAQDLAALLAVLVDAPADLRAFGEIIAARHRGEAAQRFAELTAVRPRSSHVHVYRPEERIVGDIPIRNRNSNILGVLQLLSRIPFGAAGDTTQRFTFYPDFKTSSAYRSEAEITAQAAMSAHLALKIGYLLRFSNAPVPGFKKTDNTTTASVVLRWKATTAAP